MRKSCPLSLRERARGEGSSTIFDDFDESHDYASESSLRVPSPALCATSPRGEVMTDSLALVESV
jgi:hypothetical protein